jgi:hypothetical protein
MAETNNCENNRAANVPLPHNKLGPYKGNYWGILEKDMKLLMKEASLSKLEEIILKYISRKSDLKALSRIKLDNLRKVFSTELNLAMVPFIAQLALQLPALFPSQGLEMLKRGEEKTVSLTRSQVEEDDHKAYLNSKINVSILK